MTTQHRKRSALLVTLTLLAATLFFAPAAEAQSNPYERGPDPSVSSIRTTGPYAYSTSSVSSWVSGFGGGTVYYPTGTSETFGGVVVSPGYTASSSSMAWFGRRMASHGFVVLVIDTNSRYDQPNSRGTQLLAAADWLSSSSPPAAVRNRLDSSRMAVAGHSMGGGGALRASNSRPSLEASIPFTAWHTTKTWSSNTVPQLILGAENDSVASMSSHSIPFYNGLPDSTPKMYAELRGASHFTPNSTNADYQQLSVSWLKLFVDNDTRYAGFLCGDDRPTAGGWGSTWSDVRDNCNTGWADVGNGGDDGNGDDGNGDDDGMACIRSSNASHVNNDRAVSIWGIAYARGSGDRLGSNSYFSFSSLQQIGDNAWTEVSSC